MLIAEFPDRMKKLRENIAGLVVEAHEASICAKLEGTSAHGSEMAGEMIANTVLALRHLEDAAMRFGKAIQAASGGVSPLGGPQTPKA